MLTARFMAAGAALAIGLSFAADADARQSNVRFNFASDPSSGGNAVNYRGKRSVSFNEKYRKGTIIIDTSERKLYLVTGPGKAIAYGVGVGRAGFQWSGTNHITRKAKWPGWTPPAEMRQREPWLPKYMPGGPRNPLGARALYIGSTLYRIHGTNAAHTIGLAVSSGCIRMLNREVIDLYNRVKVGARVIVRR